MGCRNERNEQEVRKGLSDSGGGSRESLSASGAETLRSPTAPSVPVTEICAASILPAGFVFLFSMTIIIARFHPTVCRSFYYRDSHSSSAFIPPMVMRHADLLLS